MKHSTLLAAAVTAFLPFSALALSYTDVTDQYKDASSFSQPERAGISLLTSLDVVQGNPDGRFDARRTLNRAEFTKIAMRLLAREKSIVQGFTPKCFPDVPADSWFEADVCTAKDLGIVKGNPDGKFYPERPVNYAEALKILVETYELDLGPTDPLALEAWYQTYMRVAAREKLTLSGVQPGDALTRGQMARLAAAFAAHAEGELELYRQAEQGKTASSSSSSVTSSSSSTPSSGASSSASSSSSVSSASSASSTSSASSVSLQDFPVRSHILLVGQLSPAIVGATVFSEQEPVRIRGAKVVLRNEADSIDRMEVIDETGKLIGTFSKDSADSTDKTWKATFLSDGAYELPKSTPRVFGVRVRLKPRDGGGASEELVWVNTFTLTLQGVWSETSQDLQLQTGVAPKHQTAQARITSVKNALPATGVVPSGSNQLLAAFAFSGTALSPANLDIEGLQFTVTKSSDVAVTNWQLGAADTPVRVSCSVNSSLVSCSAIPPELGRLQTGGRTLQLYGTVAISDGASDPFLQVGLNQAGTVGEFGAISWTDGTGHFTWVDLDSPLANGTRLD